MGCGQSQLYPRRKRRRRNKTDNDGDSEGDNDEETEGDRGTSGGGRLVSNRSVTNLVTATDREDRLNNSRLPQSSNEMPSGNSVIICREATSSQIEFFRLLDEKIEKGPDYKENDKEDTLLENPKIRQYLIAWERAKQKHLLREKLVADQIVVVHTETARPKRHLFPIPHLNGDVHRQNQILVHLFRPPSNYINSENQIRQQRNLPNSENRITLSNSVVMYDQTRRKVFTELA